MSKETGGPAFPSEGVVTNDGILYDGMTLRDYFAAKAMQAFLDRQRYSLSDETIAEWAYAIADAMLKAREK
jgi:hypothetical protein